MTESSIPHSAILYMLRNEYARMNIMSDYFFSNNSNGLNGMIKILKRTLIGGGCKT